jgi:hydroxymethylpyrimidine kinase/phosphomethylpyrimidine kinase
MLPSRSVVEEVARLIGENGLVNIVVDPVVRSTSGYDLIDDDALQALTKTLFPISTLVTPNIPEAERITGISITSEADFERAARTMQSMGAPNVLIKGGHVTENVQGRERKAKDYLFLGDDEREIFEAAFIETTATHGTGCTLSAAIAANLALGNELSDAVEISKQFVLGAIRNAPNLGHGNSPIMI